jgi:hypothetical protein
MLGVKLYEQIFLMRSPLFLRDASLEVIVISFAALLAIPASYSVLLLHDFGNFAPLFDSPLLVDFFKDFIFLML